MDSGKDGKPFGTLSLFHRHPNEYSWRDIVLATSFCRQAGNLIELYQKQKKLQSTTAELKKATEELEFANMMLNAESAMSTRAEIVSLLSHDLGHKAFAVLSSFERFDNDVRKTIRSGGNYNALRHAADRTKESILGIITGLSGVNKLLISEKGKMFVAEEFSLSKAVEEVVGTMEQALKRYNMDKNIRIPRSTTIFGEKQILSIVLFNLLINSIDAQRARTKQRKNTVHIHAETSDIGENRETLIKFWDEGPGINRMHFPKAEAVFFQITLRQGGTHEPNIFTDRDAGRR